MNTNPTHPGLFRRLPGSGPAPTRRAADLLALADRQAEAVAALGDAEPGTPAHARAVADLNAINEAIRTA